MRPLARESGPVGMAEGLGLRWLAGLAGGQAATAGMLPPSDSEEEEAAPKKKAGQVRPSAAWSGPCDWAALPHVLAVCLQLSSRRRRIAPVGRLEKVRVCHATMTAVC